MSEPFLGEIRVTGFNFAPRGWQMCNGQILPINQYQSLFSLLGTTYGGDGRTTFGLPDLRGRVAVHPDGKGIRDGSKSGEEAHTMTATEMPAHSHDAYVTTDVGSSPTPGGKMLANAPDLYHGAKGGLVLLAEGMLANTGGGQAHDNIQPTIVVNYIIATTGLYPSRN